MILVFMLVFLGLNSVHTMPPPLPGVLQERNFNSRVNHNFLDNLKAVQSSSSTARALSLPNQSLTKVNFIVVPVDYPDQAFLNPISVFSNYFNSSSLFASVSNYYHRQSYGKLALSFTVIPSTQLSGNKNTYGNPGGPWPNFIGAASQAFADRYNAGDFYTNDFNARFDLDNDDYIDGVIFLHSGMGSEVGINDQDIGSHADDATGATYVGTGVTNVFDGLNIKSFSAIAEIGVSNTTWSGDPADWVTIGIWCHEIGHMLGLPDLYETFSGGNSVIGRTGLMDLGSYNFRSNENSLRFGASPAAINPYLKYRLGWLDDNSMPTVSLDEENILTLAAFSETNSTSNPRAVKVVGTLSDEYWIVDYRNLTSDDLGFRSSGAFIWELNDNRFTDSIWTANTPNNNSSERGITCLGFNNKVPANPIDDEFMWNVGESFNSISTPNSAYNNDQLSGVSVDIISQDTATMTLRLASEFSTENQVEIVVVNPTILGDLYSDNYYEFKFHTCIFNDT